MISIAFYLGHYNDTIWSFKQQMKELASKNEIHN